MISLKRLEAMRRRQRIGFAGFWPHTRWALQAGLLRIGWQFRPLVPTEALAPAIAKAEAEHARHRTETQREVNRQRSRGAQSAAKVDRHYLRSVKR